VCDCSLRLIARACACPAALQWESGVARVLSVAGSPCCALVRRVSYDRACRSRSVPLLWCSRRQRLRHSAASVVCVCGVAALDAADCGRGRVCIAAPPLCVTTVVTSTLIVQCNGVRSCCCVCALLFDCREQQCAVVSVWRCGAVALGCCCCVCVCVRLHFIGRRSLQLSVAVVAQQRWRLEREKQRAVS
jgi:hypothetical protein